MKSASSENLEFFYQNVTGKKFVDGELVIFNEQLANVKPYSKYNGQRFD